MKIDARLAVPAVVCWATAAVLIAVPGLATWSAISLWALAGSSVAAAVIVRRRYVGAGGATRLIASTLGSIVLCAAAAATVASTISLTTPVRQPAELAAGSGTHVVDLVGTVTTQSIQSHGGVLSGRGDGRSVQFQLTATAVTTSTHVVDGSMPVQAFATISAGTIGRLQIGSTVVAHGTLRANAPEDSSAFRLFASRQRVVGSAPWWLSWANTLRSGLSESARALPGDGGDLLPGLSIGDVSSVGPELGASMKQSSLSHLTAVSGANCAVIIAVMMMLGRAVGVGRGIRVAAALAALCGFVVLVTPGPSVLRAAVMAAIIVFSTAAGRPGRGVPALAAAVVVLLVIDPWMSRNFGFALSVLATAGLLILAPPLTRMLARRMPAALAGAIAIPLAAQLACQPVLILLNPTVPLYGVAANMLAEPAAPVATVLGLVACVLLPLLPSVGFACAQLAWVPSAWIAAVAHVCSTAVGSQLPWPAGVAGFVLITAIVAVVIIGLVNARGRPMRILAVAVLLVFAGGYAGLALGSDIGRRISMPRDWQLGACDIGQGDAVLVHNGNAHGLVDVGPDPRPLAECFDTLGIDHIDLLVLTHYDQDHVGGLDAVIGRVGTALVGEPTDAHDQSLIDALARGGADVRIAASGDHGTLGRLTWQVLWPRAGGYVMQTGNEGSVTVMFDGAGVRSLFLGDLDERAQNALLASGRVQPVDVVKVAHHGSADQSERLYDAITARIGLISVGAGNDYGHPTARLLGILSRARTRPYRTDLQGLVLVSADLHGALSTWTQRAASDAALRMPAQASHRSGPGG